MLALGACGDNSSQSQSASATKSAVAQPKQENKIVDACTVVSEDFLKSQFSSIEGYDCKKGSTNRFPFCSVQFKSAGVEYGLNVTIGIIGGADEKTLDGSQSYFIQKKSVEVLEGVGDKAYIRTNDGQISAVGNGNLIHVTLYKGMKPDLALSKQMTNELLQKLK